MPAEGHPPELQGLGAAPAATAALKVDSCLVRLLDPQVSQATGVCVLDTSASKAVWQLEQIYSNMGIRGSP
jgi:hypothetical protein